MPPGFVGMPMTGAVPGLSGMNAWKRRWYGSLSMNAMLDLQPARRIFRDEFCGPLAVHVDDAARGDVQAPDIPIHVFQDDERDLRDTHEPHEPLGWLIHGTSRPSTAAPCPFWLRHTLSPPCAGCRPAWPAPGCARRPSSSAPASAYVSRASSAPPNSAISIPRTRSIHYR